MNLVVRNLEALNIKGAEHRGVKGTQSARCKKCSAQNVKRTSVRFLKGLRQRKWDELYGEGIMNDLDRVVDSKEALPEHLQE